MSTEFNPTAPGFSKHPLYQIWEGMKVRCYTKSSGGYKKYGAKGITVSDSWRTSFAAFYLDMAPTWAPGLSLDRREVLGPYSADNCRWATLVEQGNNKTNNVRLTLGTETKTIAEWANATGIPAKSIWYRINKGWSHEKALTTPNAFRNKALYVS
jgi:hypothetical protein